MLNNMALPVSPGFGIRFVLINVKQVEKTGEFNMSKIKYAKNRSKKNSKLIAVVPQGSTLVEIFTSPKALFSQFRKNSQDLNKNYQQSNN